MFVLICILLVMSIGAVAGGISSGNGAMVFGGLAGIVVSGFLIRESLR